MSKPLAVMFTASLLAAVAAPAFAAGDAAHGKALFQQRCGLCHQGAPDDGDGGQGPDLRGVVGRKAGTDPGFGYSPALKGAKLTWTPETLDQFLTAPGKMVPGTAMPVSTANPKDRADLIAYLATLKK
jgi:cytochrome c